MKIIKIKINDKYNYNYLNNNIIKSSKNFFINNINNINDNNDDYNKNNNNSNNSGNTNILDFLNIYTIFFKKKN